MSGASPSSRVRERLVHGSGRNRHERLARFRSHGTHIIGCWSCKRGILHLHKLGRYIVWSRSHRLSRKSGHGGLRGGKAHFGRLVRKVGRLHCPGLVHQTRAFRHQAGSTSSAFPMNQRVSLVSEHFSAFSMRAPHARGNIQKHRNTGSVAIRPVVVSGHLVNQGANKGKGGKSKKNDGNYRERHGSSTRCMGKDHVPYY